MDHLLICECGLENSVSRKQAGQQITCSCGKVLNVPTLRGFSELPLASHPQPVRAGSSAEVAKSAWAGWKGPVFALVMAVFIISGVTSAYNLLLRSSIDTSYTAEDFVEQGNLAFDQFTPTDLSLAWQDFEKLTLGPKMVPGFAVLNKKAKELERYAAGSGAVALLSALVGCGIWAMTRMRKP